MKKNISKKRVDVSRAQLIDGRTLKINMGVTVLIEPRLTGKRFKTEFVGMERDQYLIFRLPLDSRFTGSLDRDMIVTVRYLQGAVICGFIVRIVHMTRIPFPLIFVNYPEAIETLTLRKYERVSCYLPAQFVCEGLEGSGTIVDISGGGCLIMTESDIGKKFSQLPDKARIECRFKLLQGNQKVSIKGTVIRKQGEASRLLLGISFESMSLPIQQSIDRYVKSVNDDLADS